MHRCARTLSELLAARATASVLADFIPIAARQASSRILFEKPTEHSSSHRQKEARFIDKLRITVQAGRGGNGSVTYDSSRARGKFRTPDGGNGGAGGDVILHACHRTRSLAGLNHLHKAATGNSGGKQKAAGSRGRDCVIKLPVGTVVYLPEAKPLERDTGAQLPRWMLRPGEPWIGARDYVSDEASDCEDEKGQRSSGEDVQKQRLGTEVADLAHAGQRLVLARGGRGGYGNACGPSNLRRLDSKTSAGSPGERVDANLEVRILADVGLVGAPNAGKSSLLRALSAASPKVAPYPFTSLQPYLGSVQCGNSRLILADIPGLIPGAASNRGLGHAFLRHVSRAQALVYVLDVSSGLGGASAAPRPWQQLQSLQHELELYSRALLEKPAVVVANKIDKLKRPGATIQALRRRTRLPVIPTAAVQPPQGMSRLREELATLASSSGSRW